MRQDLLYVQQALGLRDEDIQSIEAQAVPPIVVVQLEEAPDQDQSKRKEDGATQPFVQFLRSCKKFVEILLYALSVLVVVAWVVSIIVSAISAFPVTSSQLSDAEKIELSASKDGIKAEEWFSRAYEKVEQGKLEEGIADFNKVIELKPDLALAYYDWGIAHSALGDKQSAIADYDKAIEVDKNWGDSGIHDAYNNRGGVYFALGDKQAAIADCSKAIELKPNFAAAYSNRGGVYFALGDKQAAIADYKKAIELKPNFAEAYNERGNVHFTLGNRQAAITDYSKAIALKPDLAEAYYNRGLAHSALDDKKTALVDLQKAADLYRQQGNTAWHKNALTRIKELQI